ncbi:Hint domain-containing protein [Hymenobacter crusticola]|nr:Hint domain-containing protein [Hymenobacter crusticola]
MNITPRFAAFLFAFITLLFTAPLSGSEALACEAAVCFPASVRVMLPDGRQVHISKIRPGDEVLGYDAATGQVRATRVRRLDIHSDHDYNLVQLTIGTPAVYAGLSVAAAPTARVAKVLVTPNHPFVTAGRQALRADKLASFDDLFRISGQGVETTHLVDRQPAGTAWEVYNLRTDTGNYFVNGVLVSSNQ